MTLFLVGIKHQLPEDGPGTLYSLLESCKPENITIEAYGDYARQILDQRKELGLTDFKPPTRPDWKAAYLCGYEVWVSNHYQQEHLLTEIHYLQTKENHDAMARAWRELFAQGKQPNLDAYMRRTDEHLEREIRQLYHGQPLVHISGALHVTGAYHNLAKRLEDLNPIVIPLHQPTE